MEADEGLDLRSAARVRSESSGIAFASAATRPLVASPNCRPSRTAIPRRRSAVPKRLAGRTYSGRPGSRRQHEARADRDVAVSRAHAIEQPRQLGDGMLPVGVHPTDDRVSVVLRLAQPAAMPPEAAVVSEGETCAPCSRHVGRTVGRAVVHHEDVGVRKPGGKLVEHGGKVGLLVPGREGRRACRWRRPPGQGMSRMSVELRSRGDSPPERSEKCPCTLLIVDFQPGVVRDADGGVEAGGGRGAPRLLPGAQPGARGERRAASSPRSWPGPTWPRSSPPTA